MLEELPENILFVSGWMDREDMEGIARESVVLSGRRAVFFERSFQNKFSNIMDEIFTQINDHDKIIEMANNNKDKIVVVNRSNIDIGFTLDAYTVSKSPDMPEQKCRLCDDILRVAFSNAGSIAKTTVTLLPFGEDFLEKEYLPNENISDDKKEFIRMLYMFYSNFRVHGVDREIATSREAAVSVLVKKILKMYNTLSQ
jgi:hypothetical protein